MKALAFVIAVLVIPVAAHAATKHPHRMSQGARGAYAQQQIACTPVGCLPVPRGCYPAGGKTFDGAPSGFDVMACPGGDMYGHR